MISEFSLRGNYIHVGTLSHLPSPPRDEGKGGGGEGRRGGEGKEGRRDQVEERMKKLT